jgi:hypothetical protein
LFCPYFLYARWQKDVNGIFKQIAEKRENSRLRIVANDKRENSSAIDRVAREDVPRAQTIAGRLRRNSVISLPRKSPEKDGGPSRMSAPLF